LLNPLVFSIFDYSTNAMKKTLALVSFVCLSLVISFSCDKKKGDKNAITPDYGATGNPNPNNQTVTGSSTYSNPATQNTSLLVGNFGWSNLTCSSTNSATLKGSSGNTNVTLNFAGVAQTGTYVVSTVPATGACAMTIVNAPDQPAGLVWVGRTGTVVVNTSTASINAFFTGVVCTQQTFNFPTVTASGTLSCGN
jgi:hypothetical protein